MPHDPAEETEGMRTSATAMAVNVALATAKILAGAYGHSYALIADGIESVGDVMSSLVVWSGFWIAARPPDKTHPYGHGRAESVAALFVSGMLLLSAAVIVFQSVREILSPHQPPAPYTLLVLIVVIGVKEWLFRKVFRAGRALQSGALKGDAWHHRSDALTSLAVFAGIVVALVGGPGFEAADDYAALLACGIIVWNGIRLARAAIDDLMDAAVSEDAIERLREWASEVREVAGVEKCRMRKSGVRYLVDIHILVEGTLTVRHGHEIAHAVKNWLMEKNPRILDVLVHVEPAENNGILAREDCENHKDQR